MRDASKKAPDLVLATCRKWARLTNPNAAWIVRNALKHVRESHPTEVAAIDALLAKC